MALADAFGFALAAEGIAVLTGGAPTTARRVKNRAAQAARDNFGATLALLPNGEHYDSLGQQLAVSTHFTSYERNPFSASIADAAIVLNGGEGTVAEAAFALHFGKPTLFVETALFSRTDRVAAAAGLLRDYKLFREPT